jgi:RNA-directed DNA polymerase
VGHLSGEMSRLVKLKAATRLRDIANLLQINPSHLSYILFKTPPEKKYETFEVPKRNGQKRIINAPVGALKFAQRLLSTLLQDCVEEINRSTGRKDRVSHGFKRDKSIVTNAREHRNRRYVFNVDLADFFPSINFGRVLGFFIRDRNFALDPRAAMVIARIACHENKLPQGSPCSPVISNLIAHVLDMHLVKLASRAGCTYSRYADDLTFSANERVFPADIAQRTGPDLHGWVPSAKLREIVKHCGFQINCQKTNMQYCDSRQVVTGLVVNRKINVRSEYRRNVRAMVHCLLNKGSFATLDREEGTLNQLHGMLGFIDEIDLRNKQRSAEGQEGDLSKKEQIYQKFLIYKNFFAAEAPVILCEGETDNVYLTHAIRRLAADYPDLAATDDKGKVQIKVRLYKYRHSSTARILGLRDGGSSSLNVFIATYKKETAKFKAPGQKHAVVILYDNDSGAKKIRNGIKQASGVMVMGNEPSVHVMGNLYAVPTPLLNGAQESKIEDFFDARIKATTVDGKAFSAENEFDTTIHYGKKVFAHKVVRPNADSVNFDGFRPLLDNLVVAINAHVAKVQVASAPAANP